MNERSLQSVAMRRALVTCAAALLAQAVWILAVPPFRGIDEVDHVMRASGVASGQVHLTRSADGGVGQLVWVPTGVVEAAHAQCVSRKFVTDRNCAAVAQKDDRSLVPTSAGGYNPAYYAIVGIAGKPFRGSGVDYAMRAATATLCALLLGLGVGALSFAGTGRWVTLGVLAALTPEVMFSGSIVAPNGPEIALGFVLWCAMLGAVRQPDGGSTQRGLLVLAGFAAVPLMFIRALGPLWVLLTLLSVVAVLGLAKTLALVARNRVVIAADAVGVVAGLGWWYEWQHIAAQTTGGSGGAPVVPQWEQAFDVPLFFLQMVAAFPFRNIPAPLGVYPLSFFAIVVIVVATVRVGVPGRVRKVAVGLVIGTVLIPVLLALMFMTTVGAIWQGRYLLPWAIGILPLCGLALDEAHFAPIEGRRLAALAGICLAIAHVVCPYHVQQLELDRHASLTDASWWHAPAVVLGGLMLAGCGLAWMLMHVTLRASVPNRVEVQRTL